KIQNTPTEYKGDKIYITVSIGLTGYHKEISSVDELLKKADDALYEAKSRGRNCVVKNNC
ncbi:MAG: diguanylate cyclase, partial [Candidatus Syntrophonatronum acetioxidans]